MIKTQLCIATDTKKVTYCVEVPVTEQEFNNGLAYRDNIPENTGMLYDYRTKPYAPCMYTPDTRVPVDFIFISKEGQILKISTAEPFSTEIHKAKNASWVLEINGGESAKKGIQVGDWIYCELLGTYESLLSEFPSNAKSYLRYAHQVFVKTKDEEFFYSFGSNRWINIRLYPEVSANFDIKLKNYERQNILPVSMSEQETKEYLKTYEYMFKKDFCKTTSQFFIWNRECIIKDSPLEDKIYFYIYGKGWEEIEWWDQDKEEFLKGVHISCIQATSKDVDDLIKIIEKSKKQKKDVNQRNEDFVNKPSFMGEHFEALGNIWKTMGFSNFKVLQTYITELGKNMEYPIKKDAPLPENERLFMQYMQIVYHDFGIMLGFTPKLDEDIQVALLLKKRENDSVFLSGYPFMKGYPNEVTIEGYHTWENGFEGVFTADLHNTTSVAWFDPFYLYTKNTKPLNKKAKIMFSGLAFILEKSKSNIITIDSGGMYEVQLKRFLEENPGKTAADMPPVRIELGRGTAFLSTSTVTEYEYQAKVNHVKTCKLGDKKVYKMEVTTLRDLEEDSSFTLNLYAFEHILNGYKPKKGDFVRGIMWLQGYPELIDDKK